MLYLICYHAKNPPTGRVKRFSSGFMQVPQTDQLFVPGLEPGVEDPSDLDEGGLELSTEGDQA